MDYKELLIQGVEALCKSDNDIESLIATRKEEIISLLEHYIQEIELFNQAYGLVGTSDTNELVIKHILDSLAPLGIIFRLLNSPREALLQFQIADVGSGAGLPGIPLAIAISDCDFTLIERMGRRAGFLLNTKAVLGISNINIEENELEKTGSGRFDLITFRAFQPLSPKLLKALLSSCAPGGIIAAYKGKREKIEIEMAALQTDWEVIPYKVPFLDEERHLLVIKTT